MPRPRMITLSATQQAEAGELQDDIPLQRLLNLCLKRTDPELMLLWTAIMPERPKVLEDVGAMLQTLTLQDQKQNSEKSALDETPNAETAVAPEQAAPPPEEPEEPEKEAAVEPPVPSAPAPTPEPAPAPEPAPEVSVEVEESIVVNASPSKVRKAEKEKETRYVNGCIPIPGKDTYYGQMLANAQDLCTPVIKSPVFKTLLIICVMIALFGSGLATLADIPDDPGIPVIDALMIIVTLLFALEIVGTCIVEFKSYPLSFFFWMDLVGTISMVFEVSFMLGSAGKPQTSQSSSTLDTVVMRTARAAKVGARAGRLSKLMKYFDKKQDEDNVEAKVLSSKLMLTLSTRVSMLTIVLVMVLPLFSTGQYPEMDFSMEGWTQALEIALQETYNDQIAFPQLRSKAFENKVDALIDFYSKLSYKPYKLEGFGEKIDVINTGPMTIDGANLIDHPEPVRLSNVYIQEVTECLVTREQCSGDRKATILFDFRVPKQIEAAADIGTVIFIVFCMVVISIILSYTLDKMVIQPMERMLTTVITLAGDILKQFGMDDDLEDDDEHGRDETQIIEQIFRKFAKLASLAASRNEVSEDELKNMDDESRGVMMQMMHMQQSSQHDSPKQAVVLENVQALATLPIAKSVVDSWNFDVLSLNDEQNYQVAVHLLFDSNLGRATGRTWTELQTFQSFHTEARKKYGDLPYHNYPHAIDVLHTVYRLLNICHTSKWISNVEQYALLIAALCHDLGHGGKTNQFLVETRHQLALTYNDKSPLENMHASNLFEIASHEEADIFKKMDQEARKLARKVAIAAILHTDNVNHFDMVKEIAKIYELGQDFCEAQATCPDGEFDPNYMDQILKKNTLLWLELFLHFADVSNPVKPFKICQAWAHRVLDEFFDQGDVEKSLAIPVGMLNDREKINRPGSQHGFINFMVAPFVLNSVKLFRVLHPVYTQMANNLEQWRNLWVEDVKPTAEEIAKKDADVNKVKSQAAEMAKSVE